MFDVVDVLVDVVVAREQQTSGGMQPGFGASHATEPEPDTAETVENPASPNAVVVTVRVTVPIVLPLSSKRDVALAKEAVSLQRDVALPWKPGELPVRLVLALDEAGRSLGSGADVPEQPTAAHPNSARATVFMHVPR